MMLDIALDVSTIRYPNIHNNSKAADIRIAFFSGLEIRPASIIRSIGRAQWRLPTNRRRSKQANQRR